MAIIVSALYFMLIAAYASAEQTRPCEIADISCIKTHLGSVIGLTPVEGSADSYADPEVLITPLPNFNLTSISWDTYTGLAAGVVTDYFIEDGFTALVIDIPDLVRTAEYTGEYFTRGQIPVYYEGNGVFEYKDVTLTVLFHNELPTIHDMIVFTYLGGEAIIDFTPLTTITEPAIIAAQDAIAANINTYYREVMVGSGYRVAHGYINLNLVA